jgi:hypothetical protein
MRLIVMLLSLVVGTQVWAGELTKPTGKVLLTMSGKIENTNENGKAVFDIAALRNWAWSASRLRHPGIMGVRLLRVFPCKSSWIMSGRKGLC